MRKSVHLVMAVIAVLLIVTASVMAAGVNNVQLNAVGPSGVNGMATTISGNIGGQNPYSNVEVNVRMDKTPPANMVYEGWLVDSKDNFKTSLGAFNGNMLSQDIALVNFGPDAPYDQIAVSLEPANDTNPAPATIIAQGSRPGNTISAADFSSMAVLPANDMFQNQIVAQRFGLTSDQIVSLRMMGMSYSDISLVANASQRCGNRTPIEIATMLQQGQSWDQIASSCNTTVAMLMQPAPMQAVAGYRGELTPSSASQIATMRYKEYPNGRPVVTWDIWQQLQSRGYDWREVAVAANIASMTGENIDDILRAGTIQGQTFSMMAIDRGLNINDVMKTDDWPFGKNGEKMMTPATPASAGSTGSGTMPNGTSNY